ncbi:MULTISPECIES: fimbrial protein [unclassified Serratia (in: enterobacteria)]|uniref:fimbrial protein n=1 Tax=unclassified Serratia (in: enterobacteria) TaxID=2647522 RepID=UPI000467FCA7|nr:MULTISPECIES: fimbrial protein [unclassified Serratia (in: enterobacteria)]
MTGKTVFLAMMLGMTGVLVLPAQAVQVNFQGALVESVPCTINNDELIEVDFGDNLVIRNLDGVRYSKPIPYQIDCSAAGAVRMSIQGTPASFGVFLLQTSQPGLGISVVVNGTPFPIGSNGYLTGIDLQSLQQMVAVPVANPAQPPSPGAFTARATLLAEYQ